MGPDGFAQRVEVVAAFHAGNDPAATALTSPLLYYSSHLHEVSIRQQQLPQWIIGVRIKPG